jgi:hypothetical protein
MHRMRYVVLHQQGMWNVVRGGCRYPGCFPEQTQVIEQQPYTAVAIALGLGWLLGRSHRPV